MLTLQQHVLILFVSSLHHLLCHPAAGAAAAAALACAADGSEAAVGGPAQLLASRHLRLRLEDACGEQEPGHSRSLLTGPRAIAHAFPHHNTNDAAQR